MTHNSHLLEGGPSTPPFPRCAWEAAGLSPSCQACCALHRPSFQTVPIISDLINWGTFVQRRSRPKQKEFVWVGQKGCSGFPITWFGKTQMNFLVNPVALNVLSGKNCEMKNRNCQTRLCMLCVLCLVSRVRLFVTLWTVAHQAPLSIRILRARILEWVAICPPPWIFPTQGSNPGLPHCRRILYRLSHQGSPMLL